jgi:hypothetical protein
MEDGGIRKKNPKSLTEMLHYRDKITPFSEAHNNKDEPA